MIQIKKPMQAPAILQDRGVKAARQFREQYEADPETYRGWSFDSGIYTAKSVKIALRKVQHDKCAFCESKVSHIAWGDVEHYRPKAGYRDGLYDPLIRPGYYWLAYEWSNLLFCCQLCNQRFKGNHFPLFDATQRAKSHHDDIKNEQPLFIHPAIEDLSLFIEFRAEYLHAAGGSLRGKATIEALELNREELVEVRRDFLGPIKVLIDCRTQLAKEFASNPTPVFAEQLVAIDAQLVRSAGDSAQYAAMVRAALQAA